MAKHIRLTNKQEIFVIQYLKHFNGRRAAIEAGYSENSASEIASENLTKPQIKSRIAEHMTKSAMGAEEVLFHLAQIARGDFNDVSDNVGGLDMEAARARGKTNLIKRVKNKAVVTDNSDISETEVEMYDRMRALELIGKYLSMWTDKVKLEVDWKLQAIEDIKAGKLAYEVVAEAFDTGLAEELFTQAGVTITR